MKILVIDEDESTRETLALHLEEDLDATVDGVENGQTALRLLDTEAFDLVLMDVQLPDMSGYPILENIRSRFNALELPVILVTTRENSDDMFRGLDLGANEFLIKPLNMAIVTVRVRNLLRNRQAFLSSTQQIDRKDPTASKPHESTPEKAPKVRQRRANESDSGYIIPTEYQDKILPCEIPVVIQVGAQTHFCKTIRISLREILVLTFEPLPDETTYQIQLTHPSGAAATLTVRETERTPVSGQREGSLKVNLRILSSSGLYDELFVELNRAFGEQGPRGIRSVLKPEGTGTMTGTASRESSLLFNTSSISLKVLKGARYQYEKTIGRGGFASVFLVRDLALKRHVAMKVLAPRFAAEHQSRTNFLCEAQIAAQFHHPNIVFVYEVGELLPQEIQQHLAFPPNLAANYPERFIYFTMQYIRGITLGKRMNQGSVPLDEAVHVMREVLKALAYAHKKGVFHRDIKPDNIMLTEDHQVIVTDFGIARIDTRPGSSDLSQEIVQNPSRQDLACTPQYASPEQIRGEELGSVSDLYSFGVMSYEMLSGVNPFTASQISETIRRQIFHTPPPLREVLPEAPKPLEAIVMQCMAKRPRDRFESADQVLTEFDRWSQKGTPPASERKTNRQSSTENLLERVRGARSPEASADMLRQCLARMRTLNTSDNPAELQEFRATISQPEMLNLLLERNLNLSNRDLLYQLLERLESSSAVFVLLQWFTRSVVDWEKSMLARLVVLNSGRNLLPVVQFGLECSDEYACVLLRGFGESNTDHARAALPKWMHHRGLKTQLELLDICREHIRDNDTLSGIVERFSYGQGTSHRLVQERARKIIRNT